MSIEVRFKARVFQKYGKLGVWNFRVMMSDQRVEQTINTIVKVEI